MARSEQDLRTGLQGQPRRGSGGLALALAAGLGAGIMASPALATSYSVTNLGFASAIALSANGQVATYDSATGHVFRWTAGGGAQDLGFAGGGAIGINSAGQVVGTTVGPNQAPNSFIWNPGTGMQLMPGLGDLIDPGLGESNNWGNANAINDSGQVTGWASDPYGNIRPFLWSQASGMQDLGPVPGGNDTMGFAINASGQIAGIGTIGYYEHAFRWTAAGGWQNLGAGPFSSAKGINASGAIVGDLYAPYGDPDNGLWKPQAFLWTEATGLQILPTPLDDGGSSAVAINASGLIVGVHDTSAVVWQDGAMIDLNSLLPAASGWVLQRASAVNDVGQIVGVGTYNGQTTTFLFSPTVLDIPEPATAALLGAGLFGLGLFRRRWRRG